jgi:hypothetical protein
MVMQTGNSEQRTSNVTGQQPQGGAGRVSVVWGRVIVGFVLSATGGAAFGHAWTAQTATWWWLGGMSLLAGGLLLLSVAYARR